MCRAVFPLYGIPPQTISLPPLCLTLSSIQKALLRSPGRLYTHIDPRFLWMPKVDSSVKSTCLHWLWFQFTLALHQASLFLLCTLLRVIRFAGLKGLMSYSFSRFLTVWSEMWRWFGRLRAVKAADQNLFHRRVVWMYRSSWASVTRGRNVGTVFDTVFLWMFNWRAISSYALPTWAIPIISNQRSLVTWKISHFVE